MNHEPTKLALLISLICAGAPCDVFSKAHDTAERQASSQEACDWVRNPTAPQEWPLILNGIRDAHLGSLGLSLSAAAPHDFSPPWRETRTPAAALADEPLLPPSAQAAAVDELELANAAPLIDGLTTPATQTVSAAQAAASVYLPSAKQSTATGKRRVAIKAPTDGSRPAEWTREPEPTPHQEIVVTPSAQRVMRTLAAIRFPSLVLIEAVEITPAPRASSIAAASLTTAEQKSTTAPLTAPTTAPTTAPSLTPSAQVLAVLGDVMTAPDAAEAVTADSATDDTSLKAAIAARQEVKRIKQRARAEAAELARAEKVRAEEIGTTRAARVNPFGGERVAVRDNALDRVRGGFVTNNLNIAFGIERAVYINGSLVTTTSLNISDTGRVTSSIDAKALTPGSLALIQSGAGNSVAGGAFSSASGVGLNANAIGTVVQNTLDGQKIQNITVINATANSLGALRDLNLQNNLRSSLIDSLRR